VMSESRSIFELVSSAGRDSGFDRAGIAAVPAPGTPEDYEELRNFGPWVEGGRAGEMEYLKRRDEAGLLLRSSLRVAMPWARSVIVCATNYNCGAARSIDRADPETRKRVLKELREQALAEQPLPASIQRL